MHLLLFFTRGVSLQTWAKNGSLEREIALYLRLQEEGVNISFVTYGDKEDLQYAAQLRGIEVFCNNFKLSRKQYEKLLPLLHARVIRRANLIKTNQTNGADVALRAARLWRKPLIARCGYMWSDLAQTSGRVEEAEQARGIERSAFVKAQAISVTTASMKEYVVRNYGVSQNKINIIPNYVLTDIFSPAPVEVIPNRICFVGRLSEEKNLSSLVNACAGLDVDLHFVGEGNLHNSLRSLAATLGIKLTLHGSLPHHELPAMLRKSALFVLVSPHEGHPKSLLEAMSCGAAVLGADSPGIREQIRHGETGWLVGTDAESIRTGIRYLLADSPLRAKLGENARRFILENCALDKIVELERRLYRDILNGTTA